MRSLLVPLVVILFAAGIAGGIAKLSAPSSEPAGAEEASSLLAVGALDRVKGSENARATLVEYSDFQCPACAYYAPFVARLAEEFPDDLRVAYRHFPLSQIHLNALPAAHAAEAAGGQEKFWEMHDILFEKQAEWTPLANPREVFARYAREIGADVERFRRDMNESAARDKVRDDYMGGVELRIAGTPTFFINSARIESNPRTYDEFKQYILGALSEAR